MTTVVVEERLLLFCDTNDDAVWCNILRIFGGEVLCGPTYPAFVLLTLRLRLSL